MIHMLRYISYFVCFVQRLEKAFYWNGYNCYIYILFLLYNVNDVIIYTYLIIFPSVTYHHDIGEYSSLSAHSNVPYSVLHVLFIKITFLPILGK